MVKYLPGDPYMFVQILDPRIVLYTNPYRYILMVIWDE